MLIGVLADTHDRLDRIDAALSLFARHNVEAVIHAGDLVAPFAARRLRRYDGPLHVIYGNNDGERDGLKEVLTEIQDGPLKIELGGRALLVHHAIEWCAPDDIARADVIIGGHTHVAATRTESGRLYLDPGECCGWVTGRCTVAILDTREPSAQICELEAS